ncbi:MAG TPA: hypothetical protein VGQ99_18520 [Tepidisphaeraceae bacterium]|nr:hypothetical protein [Tepidisphaeraceae bacterium]
MGIEDKGFLAGSDLHADSSAKGLGDGESGEDGIVGVAQFAAEIGGEDAIVPAEECGEGGGAAVGFLDADDISAGCLDDGGGLGEGLAGAGAAEIDVVGGNFEGILGEEGGERRRVVRMNANARGRRERCGFSNFMKTCPLEWKGVYQR